MSSTTKQEIFATLDKLDVSLDKEPVTTQLPALSSGVEMLRNQLPDLPPSFPSDETNTPTIEQQNKTFILRKIVHFERALEMSTRYPSLLDKLVRDGHITLRVIRIFVETLPN